MAVDQAFDGPRHGHVGVPGVPTRAGAGCGTLILISIEARPVGP